MGNNGGIIANFDSVKQDRIVKSRNTAQEGGELITKLDGKIDIKNSLILGNKVMYKPTTESLLGDEIFL